MRNEHIHFETLDGYVDRTGVIPSFLKIDVDGYEAQVLRGGERTLSERQPPLVIEVGHTSERVGETLEEVLRLLEAFGYEVQPVGSKERGYDAVRRIADEQRAVNVVCRPPAGKLGSSTGTVESTRD